MTIMRLMRDMFCWVVSTFWFVVFVALAVVFVLSLGRYLGAF
jgi:hypothetical protein